jgi:hypothetical protein
MLTSGLQEFWPASCLAISPSLVDSLRHPGHCFICHPWHGSLRMHRPAAFVQSPKSWHGLVQSPKSWHEACLKQAAACISFIYIPSMECVNLSRGCSVHCLNQPCLPCRGRALFRHHFGVALVYMCADILSPQTGCSTCLLFFIGGRSGCARLLKQSATARSGPCLSYLPRLPLIVWAARWAAQTMAPSCYTYVNPGGLSLHLSMTTSKLDPLPHSP